MVRKMIVATQSGEAPILAESLADDEEQLQELVRAHPDLISAEDIGLDSPLMVIGEARRRVDYATGNSRDHT